MTEDKQQFSKTFYESLKMLKTIEELGLVEEYASSNQFKDALIEQKLLLGITDKN